MATNPTTLTENSGRITGASDGYPRGSAKNDTTGTTGDGTPIKVGFMNDIYGPQQSLLRAAGLVPSGSSDTALVSQYVQAMTQLAAGRATCYDETAGTANAYVLAVKANQQMPAVLFDGLVARFDVTAANTGASTVDVSSLTGAAEGTTVLPVVDTEGDAVAAGILTGAVSLRYSSALAAMVVDSIAASRVTALESGEWAHNMLAVSQPVVPSATGSALPDTTTPRSYVAGDEIAHGFFAATDITNCIKDAFGNLTLLDPLTDTGSVAVDVAIPGNVALADLYGSAGEGTGTGVSVTKCTSAESAVGLTLASPTVGVARLTIDLAQAKAFNFGVSQQSSGVNIDGRDAVGKNYVYNAGATITGTASFDNATQVIGMTGVGAIAALELGDVVKIDGSDYNDGVRTIEGITDADEVVVNYEHRGQTTTMALVDETATSDVTITLLAKWYNASTGLGRDWCEPSSGRAIGATYQNPNSRGMEVITSQSFGIGGVGAITVNALRMTQSVSRGSGAGWASYGGAEIPANADYLVPSGDGRSVDGWYELR